MELRARDRLGFKLHGGKRAVLEYRSRNGCRIGALLDHLGCEPHAAGIGVLILEATGIGDQARVAARDQIAGTRDAEHPRKLPDKQGGGSGIGVHVDRFAHTLVDRMMVDGERGLRAIEDAARRLADALARGNVHADEGADRAVILARRHHIGSSRQQLQQVLLDGLVLDQHAGHALAELAQRGGKAELGA